MPTRRDFLAMAVAGRLSGPEWKKYPDPATELEVLRLTDPAFSSGMTASPLHQFGRRGDTFLYWSDRFGTRQAFQLDLKSGDSHEVSSATALDPLSLALNADERSITYFDGPSLIECQLSNLRTRELYKVPEGTERTGMAVGADGSVFFIEAKSRLARVARSAVTTIAEGKGSLRSLSARPHFSQLSYADDAGVWLSNLDGSGKTRIEIQQGKTGQLIWTQSGKTLLYLHIPDDPKELVTLRENDPSAKTDRLVARTSQFESVDPNADSSVFVGASRSRASSYVLLLLRVTRRELTLCEHHASDPQMVRPIFSPDSQTIYFTSDRHGKPALYRIRVEKFVEPTDTP